MPATDIRVLSCKRADIWPPKNLDVGHGGGHLPILQVARLDLQSTMETLSASHMFVLGIMSEAPCVLPTLECMPTS